MRPTIEQLESRDCPTVAITAFDASAGTVVFTGDQSANVLTLSEVQVDYGDGLKTYLSHDAANGTYADAQDVDPGIGVAHIEIGTGTAPMVTVNFGVSNDKLALASWSFAHPIIASGGVGLDTLDCSAQTQTVNFAFSGSNVGSANSLTFASFENFDGSQADDTFTFSVPAAKVTGYLHGQGGDDTMSYTGYASAVQANLTTGTATNVIGKLGSVENLTGGSGANVLVGNADANRLIGGAGNDILVGLDGDDYLDAAGGYNLVIGGAGADMLARGANDILVDGGTTYDATVAAGSYTPYQFIEAEWSRATVAINTRWAHITGSVGGLNGNYYLDGAHLVADADVDTFSGVADPSNRELHGAGDVF